MIGEYWHVNTQWVVKIENLLGRSGAALKGVVLVPFKRDGTNSKTAATVKGQDCHRNEYQTFRQHILKVSGHGCHLNLYLTLRPYISLLNRPIPLLTYIQGWQAEPR